MGGLFAARALSSAPVQVTLLDRAEHHLFQPMLYQCATGIMSEGKIAYPLRELLRKHGNVEFVIAEVNGIDAAERRVQARRPLRQQIEFGYDYLILASATASERYSAAPRSTSTASSTTVRERSSRQHNLPARTKS